MHEGYLCPLPFLSRRAHLPATTPAPALPRGSSQGGHNRLPTDTSPKSRCTASSGVTQHSSFFLARLLIAPSTQQGRVGCTYKAGSRASPACADMPPTVSSLLSGSAALQGTSTHLCWLQLPEQRWKKPLPNTLPSTRSKCLFSHLPQRRSLTTSLYFSWGPSSSGGLAPAHFPAPRALFVGKIPDISSNGVWTSIDKEERMTRSRITATRDLEIKNKNKCKR